MDGLTFRVAMAEFLMNYYVYINLLKYSSSEEINLWTLIFYNKYVFNSLEFKTYFKPGFFKCINSFLVFRRFCCFRATPTRKRYAQWPQQWRPSRCDLSAFVLVFPMASGRPLVCQKQRPHREGFSHLHSHGTHTNTGRDTDRLAEQHVCGKLFIYKSECF